MSYEFNGSTPQMAAGVTSVGSSPYRPIPDKRSAAFGERETLKADVHGRKAHNKAAIQNVAMFPDGCVLTEADIWCADTSRRQGEHLRTSCLTWALAVSRKQAK
jgi:hypothetical protein